ncbi:N-acetyltransferase [Solibaculum mannosilyticum]|uniref:N-acetyltransferase n=2 Tax=Solibaculum mannosilyticum TaxID=2780922 RepID=A0A7I8CZ47_9FIRM|nr:N-acetyltransferase [Solibaculum mannosilyticum]
MGLVNTPTLETARLRLRKFTEGDIDALFSIYRDPEVNTYLPWLPLTSLDQAKAFFAERYAKVYEQPMGYRYAICLKEDDVPIGYINVSTEDNHDLGYGLHKRFWHRGIVTEAGKAVIEQVQKDGFFYITATHDVDNPRSGEVMKRLGMQYQYSYEERWMPKDKTVIFRMYQRNFDGENDRVYRKYWDNSSVHFVEENI